MPLTTTLTRTPTAVLIMRFARLELTGVVRRVARAMGLDRAKDLAADDLAIPESQLVRQATELVSQLESPMLFNHSVRSYLFGRAIGHQLKWKVDAELLYLAAVLHDIGLTKAYDGDGPFELNGARAAHEFLIAQNMPKERADLVHEAIALHTSVGIAGERGPEIALTHFGSGLDVIGFHAEDVSRATREEIVGRNPRMQFKRDFQLLLQQQVEHKPNCHIAGHWGLGFARKIQFAPFAE